MVGMGFYICTYAMHTSVFFVLFISTHYLSFDIMKCNKFKMDLSYFLKYIYIVTAINKINLVLSGFLTSSSKENVKSALVYNLGKSLV